MTKSIKCTHCNNNIPLSEERCPHCALPGLFPNVHIADTTEEREALNKRYKEAFQRSISRGCEDVVRNFEQVVSKSKAVIARSLSEAYRLATSENEIYSTFYKIIESGIRLPSGSKWDQIRTLTDDALFPGFKKHIRFAALSLDGQGLSNYGDCSLVLHEDMINHRSSVFEENSVTFMKNHGIKISEPHEIPLGYRAIWKERARLCVAKLADMIHSSTNQINFPSLLLKNGNTSADDKFIEVHIWGPMTIRTIESVFVKKPKKRISKVILKALQEKLKKLNVKLELS